MSKTKLYLGIAAAAVVYATAIYQLSKKPAFDPWSLEDSVVKVTALDSRGSGTGFLVSTPRGLRTVTNNHVCDIATGGRMRVSNSKTSRIVRVIKSEFGPDLCVLEPFDGTPLTLSKTPPNVRDALYTGGHPLGKEFRMTRAIYYGEKEFEFLMGASEDGKCPKGANAIEIPIFGGLFSIPACAYVMQLGQISPPIFPGNSGSPCVNAKGEVIGVVNSGDSRDNEGGIIPLRDLRTFLSRAEK